MTEIKITDWSDKPSTRQVVEQAIADSKNKKPWEIEVLSIRESAENKIRIFRQLDGAVKGRSHS